MADRITTRQSDFAKWYTDIIQHAKLADYSPVRGCMILRPNGYALWEVLQKELDSRFKATGHRNAYFPLFIPESFIKKEKDHVEGFAPQLAVVTHGGGKELDEPLIVRPTSETIINSMYSKWITSYRDLPLLINQWANVVRWEMRTRPFIRTTEFLWQEGHTCHATEEEGRAETLQMLNIYEEVLTKVFAVPVVTGRKTESEKFAGALETYCLETMMQDKKAVQAATSHYFGTKFAEVFDIKFQDKDGQVKFVHQTSWGMTTRAIGILIMTHSDDQGLVLPPKAAPYPIVVIPILQKNKDNEAVISAAKKIHADLSKKFSVILDDRLEHSAGYKFNEWEVQGIPLRIELGPRDLEQNVCVFSLRDRTKQTVSLNELEEKVPFVLEAFQTALYDRAKKFLESNTFLENQYSSYKERIETEGGFFHMHWCGSKECEEKIKEETKSTIRCIPFHPIQSDSGTCILCHSPSSTRVVFAKNY